MRALALCLLLATGARAGDVEPWKIEMIPGLWPWQRRDLAVKVHAAEDGYAAMEREGVNAEFVRRLRALEPGPFANERLSHLAVHRSALTDKQRRLFDAVVPAIDAAELALWAHRKKLLRELGLKRDDPQRLRIHGHYDRQVQEMERRFWRVVLYALTVDQRAGLKSQLPQAHQNPPDVLFHVYQLPGLTASQAARVTALVQEITSENAADTALAARLEARLEMAPADEHAAIRRELLVVGDRSARRLKRVVEDSLKIYTPDQTKAAYALVPVITAGERAQHPGTFFKEMNSRPEQMAELYKLGGAIQAAFKKTQTKLQERLAEAQRGETGEESPQKLEMGMMQQNAAAERIAVMEANARVAILDILAPEQVARWVISPR